jgi:cytochrome P450
MSQAPLPPVLISDPIQRQPPADLARAVGPFLASFIHHYRLAGPIYRYAESSGDPTVVLAGVEANLFVGRHGRQLFGAQAFRQKQLAELGSDKYLAGMDGDAHYRQRKLQTRGYARSLLDERYPELVAITEKQIGRWQTDETINVYRWLQAVVVEQLGSMILNDARPERWQHICYYVSAMLRASFAKAGLDERQQAAYRQLKQEMMALMDEVIAIHRLTGSGPHRPDLVDDLLAAAGEGGEALTEQELRIAALTVYIAGIEPVAYSCTFMLYALLRQPELLARLVEEVDRVVSRGPLSPKTLREMECLRYTTMEVLRLYPFAPILQMTALEAFEFQGYRVEAGTPVIASQAVAHLLPEIYADPCHFDIDRYRPERAEHRHPGAYVPYGIGPHGCLGAGFSEVQIMVTMATLLHTAELVEAPESRAPLPGSRDRDAFKVRLVRQRRLPGVRFSERP